MKVERKQLRKFIFISNLHSMNMGYAVIEKVTSEELPGWKVYQFEEKSTIRVENTGEYEGYVDTTVTRVVDFPSFNEALEYISHIENKYSDNSEYRTFLEH